MATRRIQKEYNEILQEENKFGNCFNIEFIENDMFRWRATLKGPTGTPYTNGQYILHITMSDEYPLKPPSIYFINPPYCLNVAGHDDNTNDNDSQFGFGYVSFNKIQDLWSPALKINTILQELYNLCFFQCGYDPNYDINNPTAKTKIFLNKYKLYLYKPREFLFTVSRYNELYGNGDKAIYYILPQINEMEYFQTVSVIDTMLRDKYQCDEDVIEQFLMFHGNKMNFCGLNNNKFKIPPFNDIEDTNKIQEAVQVTKYRTYDEIQTDITNAVKEGQSIEISMGGIVGCASRTCFKGYKNLSIGDVKVIYWETRGQYHYGSDFRKFVNNGFFYGGKRLDDKRTLNDYNYNGGMIYIVYRLYGG